MSLLLYAIAVAGSRQATRLMPELPSGVGGAPTRLIEANGLGAAASRVEPPDLTPSVERALAYARVVEALHADRTVLPLRYGCVLDQESDVMKLLCTQGRAYAERLQGLDGCVEMGVRVLAAKEGSGGTGNSGVESVAGPRDLYGFVPGMAYLIRRRAVHAERERNAQEGAAFVPPLCAALAGLFVKCQVEHGAALGPRSFLCVPLLSLHFLVERDGLPSFLAAARRIDFIDGARLLLSGPWPPYNFAVPELRNE